LCAAVSLDDAVATVEELEETAKVYRPLRGSVTGSLSPPEPASLVE
jgi:glycine cleavage system H lipoate-binding protein